MNSKRLKLTDLASILQFARQEFLTPLDELYMEHEREQQQQLNQELYMQVEAVEQDELLYLAMGSLTVSQRVPCPICTRGGLVIRKDGVACTRCQAVVPQPGLGLDAVRSKLDQTFQWHLSQCISPVCKLITTNNGKEWLLVCPACDTKAKVF
ncbi:hypothetical protein BASA81_001688 [Batrachochytrium salamandrivorans]|nr:hypothetical protein BASA81_001688 [Batrachochytrium salamandrivorans]